MPLLYDSEIFRNNAQILGGALTLSAGEVVLDFFRGFRFEELHCNPVAATVLNLDENLVQGWTPCFMSGGKTSCMQWIGKRLA